MCSKQTGRVGGILALYCAVWHVRHVSKNYLTWLALHYFITGKNRKFGPAYLTLMLPYAPPCLFSNLSAEPALICKSNTCGSTPWAGVQRLISTEQGSSLGSRDGCSWAASMRRRMHPYPSIIPFCQLQVRCSARHIFLVLLNLRWAHTMGLEGAGAALNFGTHSRFPGSGMALLKHSRI